MPASSTICRIPRETVAPRYAWRHSSSSTAWLG
jgi:hypothetical protein